MGGESAAPIERVDVSVYQVPTERPESNGTPTWDHTILVMAEPSAGGKQGLGYTCADLATGKLIEETLVPCVVELGALAPAAAWRAMVGAVRNLGSHDNAAMAISTANASLRDLQAKLLGVPLVRLLDAVREEVPVYRSGSLTSYSVEELRVQLAGWVAQV